MIKCWVSVRLETAPTSVAERVSCASLVSIKNLASQPLNGFLAKNICLPGLAQETYSTIPVGAIK